jgi:phosphoglycolate phosphatase-like HAD superfamily hydrolase
VQIPDHWAWRDRPVEPGPAVVFDLDGVLSDATDRQHLIERPRRDWDAFFEACADDEVIAEVARLLDLLDDDLRIVLLTGRPVRVQRHTLTWLEMHGLRWDLLIMRHWGDYQAARDFKQDTVGELRDRGFDLRLAFEDDRRNVDMFHAEGVPCIYIHSGYYD